MLTPMFAPNSFADRIDRFINQKLYKMIEVLNYVGETFVTEERNKRPEEGSYHDDTGNLRSSVGYLVGLDGKPLNVDLKGTSEGRSAAKELLYKVLQENRTGLVLIVCAGMGYGAAVEAKGYDVLSGGIPNAKMLLAELRIKTGLQ